MSNSRSGAMKSASSRKAVQSGPTDVKPSQYYGESTFNGQAMRDYLPQSVLKRFRVSLDSGEKLERDVIDQIASAMKAWAISKGATHYTHWFQPLTGATAEKHDAFVSLSNEGVAMEKFDGAQLVQQEPDASSFPSGGIRNTFEARGYTAWDPSSPAFIREGTLCIPSVYISYTGEALDFKTPLIKALQAVEKAATAVCHLFDASTKKVSATLGWEQEYFLIDKAFYFARPDLVLTGRTVFGHASAKDQQLEDHYFGIIPERVNEFMKDFEREAHRLGIPVKTRHNEVAPNQFECAPMFEEVITAVDHNQLIMDIIERIAERHNFKALLHEKPFAGINGSGKHNNWSLMTDSGQNLLSPGKDAISNLRFLTFFSCAIKAVHENAGLLRASIASASNDLRLGGNEAPPAIISVFIGSHLTKLLDQIEKSTKPESFFNIGEDMHHSIARSKIPEILLDNTDRNRTSPFAFTGNKFEFRAVGSSANCSAPMIVLNTAMADVLNRFKSRVDELISKGKTTEHAIMTVIRRFIKESRPVLFEGNNYSNEWLEEAKKRKLPVIPDTPHALDFFLTKETEALFSRNGVFSARELHARHEIKLENYIKKLQIEARVVGDLAGNHILPVAIRYQNILLENIKGLKEVLPPKDYEKLAAAQIHAATEISSHLAEIRSLVDKMINRRKLANQIENLRDRAIAYHDKVYPYLEQIRYQVDKLEMMVDDEMWTLPKYREILFVQ